MAAAGDPSGALDEFWPTEDQESLLRAALSSGEEALVAWKTWKSRNHLIDSELDQGSFRLLPLVYKNLTANGAKDDGLMTRLKGVYRYWWCANQQLFHETVPILEGFHQAGIRTMILKGAALSSAYYRDGGVRPMSDVDVLVPYRQAPEAFRCLARMGWRSFSRTLNEDLRFRHASQFLNDKDREFDLHWHVFFECLWPDSDDELWRRAVPTELLHVPTYTLSPADILLHTIVHGIDWNPMPPIRWISDSMAIMRSAGETMDWDLVLEQAGRRRLLLRFGRGLRYLRDTFDAPVPDDVIRRLAACRPSYSERMEYSYLTLGAEGRSRVFFGYYPFIVFGFLRYAGEQGFLEKAAALPEYLRYHFSVDRRTDVLWMVLRDAARKTRKVLTPRPVDGRP